MPSWRFTFFAFIIAIVCAGIAMLIYSLWAKRKQKSRQDENGTNDYPKWNRRKRK